MNDEGFEGRLKVLSRVYKGIRLSRGSTGVSKWLTVGLGGFSLA